MTTYEGFYRIEYHDETGHVFSQSHRNGNLTRIIEDATDYCIPGEGFTIYRLDDNNIEYRLIRKGDGTQMTKSYEEMLHIAILKIKNAKRHQEIAETHPDNEDAQYFAIRESIAANVLCDAIAYMFDRNSSTVIWEAYDTAEAIAAQDDYEVQATFGGFCED